MFLWMKDNRTHIEARHQVTVEEVEEVFYNNPLLRVSNSQPNETKHYRAFGQTDEGRYLMVVFVKAAHGRIKPFSAREMTAAEKRKYSKR